MQIDVKKLPKSQVEITVEMNQAEMEPHVKKAAEHISEHRDIKGFRRGHAPYEKVKQEVGEMAIYEAALERMVQTGYYQAIREKQLQAIGAPKVDVKKLAPGNSMAFTAVVGVLPEITLPDFTKISVEKKPKSIGDKEVEDTIESLRKMRGTEVSKETAAEKENKVVVDMDLLVDKVPVEGGQTKDHGIYLNEEYYVPGLPEQLVGLKKGDEKEFMLAFPKEHYQKHLAGKDVQFKVKVKDVMERQFPEVNEEFAKGLGQESLTKLKELLKENLQSEASRKEDERQEIEMLEGIIEKAKFGDIPDVLIDAEKRRIFADFKHRVESQGLSIDDYLKSIDKTPEQVAEGYKEQAEKRVKTTLALRQYALDANIEVTPEDMAAEIETMKEAYKDQPDVLRQLESEDTHESLKVIIRNRKAVKKLKEQIVK